jgi:hypothetical protein
MSTGSVSILNVGAGDIELSFNRDNPAECIRAARIVKDMLRRGYALLIEVERDGVRKFERALDFDDTQYKYIIADFDPVAAQEADKREEDEAAKLRRADEKAYGEEQPPEIASSTESPGPGTGEEPRTEKRRGRPRRAIAADSVKAVAVGRSAGG